MLAVHPNGVGSKACADELTTGFGPHTPDYSGIASAAGDAWGQRVESAKDVDGALYEAVRVVLQEGRCAVVDCVLDQP